MFQGERQNRLCDVHGLQQHKAATGAPKHLQSEYQPSLSMQLKSQLDCIDRIFVVIVVLTFENMQFFLNHSRLQNIWTFKILIYSGNFKLVRFLFIA